MKPWNKLNLDSLIGEKYGRMTILSIDGSVGQTHKVTCKCDCGNIKQVRLSALRYGHTTSCGCFMRETTIKKNLLHGLANHPLNTVWGNMKSRCYNPANKNYRHYGGRGVRVCQEWVDSFESFCNWAINNGWESGLQLDKDIKGNGLLYGPNTCCFVSSKDNCRCKKGNRAITYNGETKTIIEWSEIYNINYMTLYNRLKKYPPEIAFFAPIKPTRKPKHESA